MEIYHACQNRFLVSEGLLTKKQRIAAMKKANVDGYIYLKVASKIKLRIFNLDGSEATMCGNGIRCAALYLKRKNKFSQKANFATLAGLIEVTYREDKDEFSVYLPKQNATYIRREDIFFHQEVYPCYTSFVGTKNHVVFISSISIPLQKMVDEIQQHFKNESMGNLSFCQIFNSQELFVMTYERGVGFTASCGTGNATCFRIARQLFQMAPRVTIHNLGGSYHMVETKDCIVLEADAHFEKEIEI